MSIVIFRILAGIILAVISYLMFRKWYYKYPTGKRWYDADEDFERPEWSKAYNKYYVNMVKAMLIGFFAICLVFWDNIAVIIALVIVLYFSFKYFLLKKADFLEK